MPISSKLLPDSVGHRTLTGKDAHGTPTYGSSVVYTRCRVINQPKMIELPGGEVVQRGGKVVFSAAPQVSLGDLVVLPDGSERRVLTARMGRNGDGSPHHTSLEFS